MNFTISINPSQINTNNKWCAAPDFSMCREQREGLGMHHASCHGMNNEFNPVYVCAELPCTHDIQGKYVAELDLYL